MGMKTDAFRDNVRRFCKLQGLKQKELAARAGLSPEWLCEMLGGKSNPTLPVCERISDALGVSLEALISIPSSGVFCPPENSNPALLTRI
jgi:transcriptional regulator with XRE-family HTH domain